MAAVIPLLQTGTGAITVTTPTGYRQMLVKNMDAAITINLAWNGSGGTWPLEARERLGIALTGKVITVTLTPASGSPAWAILLQG